MARAMAAAGAALLALMAAAPANANPWKIKIGYAPPPGHMQPIVQKLETVQPNLFHHLGKSYVDEGVHFQGSTPQIEALATGDLQIAAFGPEALALSVNNAHLDTRMVADVFQDGVPGYRSLTYLVLANSPIRTIEDLKGTRVATNAIGSLGDSAMRVVLHAHGIMDNEITSGSDSPTCRRCCRKGKWTSSIFCRSSSATSETAHFDRSSVRSTAKVGLRRNFGRCARA